MEKTLVRRNGHLSFEPVAPHVARISHQIVNSYLVDDPESGEWVLVDAGLRTSAKHIFRAAAERFGDDSRPAAIVLTHGHFDHVGAVEKLAAFWEVPVYAHPLELPYLTGKSSYPPPDPGVGGGMMSLMSAFFTRGPIDITDRVQILPSDGTVPGLRNWRWIHTPGHTPGHISLFEEKARILIAGDAFVTTKQESAMAVMSQRQQVNGPPAYFTQDWEAARNSVHMLASLNPRVAATGHGIPMRGEQLTHQLGILADNFQRDAMPQDGRYVRQPVVADESGTVSIPPRISNPWLKFGLIAAGAIGAALAVSLIRQNWRGQT